MVDTSSWWAIVVDMSTRMLGFELDDGAGKVAVVIGGTKGIGKEIARGLVERGVTTIVASRGVDEGEKAARELSAIYHRVDIADEASITALADFVRERHGRLDILVNDAALAISRAPAPEVTLDEMRKVFKVNVLGVVASIHAFMPL
ncbi:MAG TPA: SDR family NAD(P)-dependent oxidoreductase, partial [Kofleriaceae bacterium]